MIRKLISRVFGGKKATASHHEPAVIPVSIHGITRDRISTGSRRVCEGLQQQGHKAFVVGGAVRDLLIGAEPKDFDIATDASIDIRSSNLQPTDYPRLNHAQSPG